MIQSRIEKLLSKEYHCSVEALHKKGTVYSVKPHTEQPYIKILAYRNCVVVCTSEDLREKYRDFSRTEAGMRSLSCRLYTDRRSITFLTKTVKPRYRRRRVIHMKFF